MSVSIYIPTPYRRHTNGVSRVEVEAGTVRQVLDRLVAQHPALAQQVFDDKGEVLQYLGIFVNDEEVHSLGGLDIELKPGDELALIPAIAGGSEDIQFTEEQIIRYSRHIILKEVGGEGQKKLLKSKVLIIGAGGLGCPAAVYLAAAGVGTIGIVDFDRVDLSNLQRQILHGMSDIGRPKAVSAKESIAEINPDVNVVLHETALSRENALDIIKDYDVVVNGCDNFPTRYLVSDACVLSGKPLVDGSILRFEGQATVFMPGKGCYRCLFPAPPPPGTVPSCSEAGVLGVLPGIVGCIQANEAIKVILGVGETLSGRLLFFDALNMEFRKLKLRRDPNCPACGDNPAITELIDYHGFCGVPNQAHVS